MEAPLKDNEFEFRPGETGTVKINFRPRLATGENINGAGTWTWPTGITEVATSFDDDSVSAVITVDETINDTDQYTLEGKHEGVSSASNNPEDCIYIRVVSC